MEYLVCDGSISVDGSTGELSCSGAWSGLATVEHTLVIQELEPADIAELLGAAMVVFAIAAGIRYVRKTMWR